MVMMMMVVVVVIAPAPIVVVVMVMMVVMVIIRVRAPAPLREARSGQARSLLLACKLQVVSGFEQRRRVGDRLQQLAVRSRSE